MPGATGHFVLPDCYIYLYHTDEYFIIPTYPDDLNDNNGVTFRPQNALSRTAPVQSYSESGPRTVQFSFKLHRDMLDEYNVKGSNVRYNAIDGWSTSDIITSMGDDYVDILSKKLQSIAYPNYNANSKEVVPPRVAVRIGTQLFITGIVNGSVGVHYNLPIMETTKNGIKYALVTIDFTVTETQPYDANEIGKIGSYRGLTSGLKAKVGLANSSSNPTGSGFGTITGGKKDITRITLGFQ